MKPAALVIAVLLAGCQGGTGASVPGDSEDKRPFSAIAADETLTLIGTEPFWGGKVSGSMLTYTTLEDQDGTAISVERFAGRGGAAFSGALNGDAFDMMVTPGDCSDGMSDRTYPFVVTLRIGSESRKGCAWSDRKPFDGPQKP